MKGVKEEINIIDKEVKMDNIELKEEEEEEEEEVEAEEVEIIDKIEIKTKHNIVKEITIQEKEIVKIGEEVEVDITDLDDKMVKKEFILINRPGNYHRIKNKYK